MDVSITRLGDIQSDLPTQRQQSRELVDNVVEDLPGPNAMKIV